MSFTVRTTDGEREREFETRNEAEEAIDELEALGLDVELVPPQQTDGGATKATVADVPDEDPRGTEPETVDPAEFELPERSVSDNPLNWVPGDFVDTIDGTPAINRMGFEVLGHFYNVDVEADLDVAPEGRRCEAFGSAHVDRDDDPALLLEMADTRARKRALSIATGTGAVAVEELKSEVDR